MKKNIEKTINLDLVRVDGNAFAIMGAFSKQAKREGWTKEEIECILDEARSSNYEHLIATIANHCEVNEGEDLIIDFD
ncbi:MAG: hypothetical protein GKR88_15345 [Flavobacteriaceae bacterium]|nr:MAG: hypothetical protein GKR88_15345 [Flavobacteriaceae bacterium]